MCLGPFTESPAGSSFPPSLSSKHRHKKQIYNNVTDYSHCRFESDPMLQAAKSWFEQQISVFKALSDQAVVRHYRVIALETEEELPQYYSLARRKGR